MEKLENMVRESKAMITTASDFKLLLEQSMDIVKTPPRNSKYYKPGIIELGENDGYFFIGDIHGDFYGLLSVLKMMWEKLNEGYFVIFLGDYIDRGYMQLETLSLVLTLKNELRDQVVLMRGNHEPAKWLIPYPHDYPDTLRSRYGSAWRELYELSLKFFNELTLACILEGHFISVHGGPPLSIINANTWRDAFYVDRESMPGKELEIILWSDPIDLDIDHAPSPRGAGVLYGLKVTEKALRLINGKYVIRGHEAVNGISTSHGNKVYTVFTSPLVYGLSYAGMIEYNRDSYTGDYKLVRHLVKPIGGFD
ncbi:MAG: metallophosphoesterase family protein [Desulfurococcaceae archaeon]